MMVGPNGCGKSSIFDGFLQWKTRSVEGLHEGQLDYYIRGKQNWDRRHQIIHNQVSLEFHSSTPTSPDAIRRSFYFRTAYRFEGSFAMSSIEKVGPIIEERRAQTMAESDTSVSKNYSRIVSQLVNDIHQKTDDNTAKGEWRDQRYKPIQESLNRLFPNLTLEGPGNPLEDGTFYFSKGDIENFRYGNLSSGEKAALDLLLDLHVRSGAYPDSIYCLDEPEAHMNTNLHGALLEELFKFIPEKSQMWVATHSIGMIRKAMELSSANSDEVVFIDFHDLDMDGEISLNPAKVNPSFWSRNLRTTLSDLSEIVSPKTIVLCEGASAESGAKKAEFDAQCYQRIFENEFPENLFISVGSSSDILSKATVFKGFINKISRGSKISTLIDSDERTEGEIKDAVAKGHLVLPLRHIEHYLLADEILTKLCEACGQPEAFEHIIAAKKLCIQNLPSIGYASDDIKKCKGQIYLSAKNFLRDSRKKFGTNADIFCRDVMAPLITPETQTYQALRSAIFETSKPD